LGTLLKILLELRIFLHYCPLISYVFSVEAVDNRGNGITEPFVDIDVKYTKMVILYFRRGINCILLFLFILIITSTITCAH
jgi:hypothetical protein